MVVVLPSDTSAGEWRKLEAVVSPEVQIEFVPKETGLAELKTSLFGGGMPADTGVLADIPGNPVPDILIVRASRPDLYEQIAGEVKRVLPNAQIQYDAPALRRMARLLKAGKFLSALTIILLAVLFCLSFADRLTMRRFGFVQALSSAILSALVSIMIAGGAMTAIGFAAEKHPDLWIRPYADLAAQFFRHFRPDWIFAVECLAGWMGLAGCSAFLSARSHEKAN